MNKVERQMEDAIDAMIAARNIIDAKQARIELLEKVVEAAEVVDRSSGHSSYALNKLSDAIAALKT